MSYFAQHCVAWTRLFRRSVVAYSAAMTHDPSAPSATLHYIFDPLCGWCYAASPLLRAIAASPLSANLDLKLHPGLLFETPRNLDPSFRQHIVEADQHIHRLSGVRFGEAYIARVKNPAPLILDSTMPSASVLAAEAIRPGAGLDMLAAIQRTHYDDGHDVCKLERLHALAATLSLPADAFKAALNDQLQELPAEAQHARGMLHASGAQGFPTFVLEIGGRRIRLDHGPFYAKPQAFIDQITHTVSHSGESA